ncbi:siderophore-interacting protein [Nitriliruptor alkaliphilus]|uniref:siderophore-interacting protein n=1 Tax=Nitriliruptor alkaliphilus TaxID=427918 RepID=UPI000696E4C2|nr:siderophore-interacting protein [Nitriliruptor alkaliphilus]
MYGTVIRTEWLTPDLVRLVLGGSGLAAFDPVPCTDAYVNVALPPRGAPYAGAFDVDEVKVRHPREWWPHRRRYTVRSWDPERRELTLDIVIHGDQGVGGPWAAAARLGDVLVFGGPAGSYRPDQTADRHLLVGDESALPAIAASAEAAPHGTQVTARLLVNGPAHEVPFTSPGQLDLRWLHRTGDPAVDVHLLADEVRGLDLGTGRVQAFVHGEAEEVRAIRRHLLADRSLAQADLSCSPYWRRHLTDEAWREVKADWNAAVEDDIA